MSRPRLVNRKGDYLCFDRTDFFEKYYPSRADKMDQEALSTGMSENAESLAKRTSREERGQSAETKKLSGAANFLKNYINYGMDPHILSFDPTDRTVKVYDERIPESDIDRIVTSITSSAVSVHAELEVLRLLKKFCNAQVKQNFHPQKRKISFENRPRDLFKPGPVQVLKEEANRERLVTDSLFDGAVATPKLSTTSSSTTPISIPLIKKQPWYFLGKNK